MSVGYVRDPSSLGCWGTSRCSFGCWGWAPRGVQPPGGPHCVPSQRGGELIHLITQSPWEECWKCENQRNVATIRERRLFPPCKKQKHRLCSFLKQNAPAFLLCHCQMLGEGPQGEVVPPCPKAGQGEQMLPALLLGACVQGLLLQLQPHACDSR